MRQEARPIELSDAQMAMLRRLAAEFDVQWIPAAEAVGQRLLTGEEREGIRLALATEMLKDWDLVAELPSPAGAQIESIIDALLYY